MESGIDKNMVDGLRQKIGRELQYPVLFDAMPLGDAVAYAEFVVRTTIDRFRFVIGAELCTGPIDLAAITRRDGFKWLRSKTRLT